MKTFVPFVVKIINVKIQAASFSTLKMKEK